MTQISQPLRLTSGFDPERIALIRLMEEDGWTGRISKQGHAIMRAPDGVSTCSISPKVKNGRSGENVGAEYRRWKREQLSSQGILAMTLVVAEGLTIAEDWGIAPRAALPVEPAEPVDTTPPVSEPEPEPARLPCTECGKDFATLQALSVHRSRSHTKAPCPICAESYAPGNLPRHQATHLREFADLEAAVTEVHRLRRQLAEAQREAVAWEVLADEAEERHALLQARIRAAIEIR